MLLSSEGTLIDFQGFGDVAIVTAKLQITLIYNIVRFSDFRDLIEKNQWKLASILAESIGHKNSWNG
ncbi:hypothetical protein Trydic_g9730 [Trypoxylus dichotomus]